jgi:DNA ligase (NAD+)
VVERGAGERFTPPTDCPSCGETLARAEGEVALRCPNRLSCRAQLIEGVQFFAAAMDLENLGPKLTAQLIERGLVGDVADLFALRADALVELERMGEKSAENIVHGMEKARRTATLSRTLSALGIPHVGEVAARSIAQRFERLEQLVRLQPDELAARLEGVRGLGKVIAGGVATFFADPRNRRVVEKLVEFGVNPGEPRGKSDGPLAGKSFCVTGTLSRPRGQVRKDIENAGGRFASAVTKETQFLVAGADTGEQKLAAARKHGTQVIDEAVLYAMIAGS